MFMQLIRNRRSIRKYQQQEVPPKAIDTLIEAALRSPSSRSLNPWEFVVVTDRDTLKALSECKPHGASFLKGAPLGIVVIADPERCDVWVEDTSIASTYIQLAAESEGLRSCWIQIRKRFYEDGRPAGDRVAEILGIPESYEVEAIVAVGYPDETKSGHAESSLQMDKVHFGRFGEKR